MPEAALLSVLVKEILTKLGAFAYRELGLVGRVRANCDCLRNTLSILRSAILDAEANDKSQDGDKLEKLKDVVYDIEDLIDEFGYHDLQKDVLTRDKSAIEVRKFFHTLSQLPFRFEAAQRVKEIKKKLNVIVSDQRLRFELIGGRHTTEHQTLGTNCTYSFVPDKEVIGRAKDKERIVDLLLDTTARNDDVSFIAIEGIGGLGKTTLAQYAYNDERVTKHFDMKLWISLSCEPLDIQNIIEKILENATKKKPKIKEIELLQSQLRDILGGKKFLLLLDNLWNEDPEKLNQLNVLLMGGATGSKILITTRSPLRARGIDPIRFSLKGLSEENSWVLFKKMAFIDEEEASSHIKTRIGHEIIEKCKGAPLAIRVIGGMLSSKLSDSDWLSFERNELSTIIQEENVINSVLSLSYIHLPANLKHCFSYCSLFPKGWNICGEMLINLWIAQGLVDSSRSKKFVEDLAQDYLMNIAWRMSFQEVDKEYRMHDLIYDLAQFITKNKCIGGSLDAIGGNIDKRTRHIFLDWSKSERVSLSSFKEIKLRTLLIWKSSLDEIDLDNGLLMNLTCLRALRLGPVTQVPSNIGKLKLLKYLDLSSNEHITLLPDSITSLYYLEAVNLRYCRALEELPRNFHYLTHLWYLNLEGCSKLVRMPSQLGRLTHLRTLNLFVLSKIDDLSSIQNSGLNELRKLVNLRGCLRVRGLEQLRSLSSEVNAGILKDKQYLENLHLKWETYGGSGEENVKSDETILECLQPHENLRRLGCEGYDGVRFYTWLPSLSCLVSLEISFCRTLKHIPPFDGCLSLKSLKLLMLDSIEYIYEDDSLPSLPSPLVYPSLESMKFSCMPNLKGWRRRQAYNGGGEVHNQSLLSPKFPRLLKLDIQRCPNLRISGHLPSLLKLELDGWRLDSILDHDGEDTPRKGHENLQSLRLENIPDLDSLPHWVQHGTAMQHFYIHRLSNLTALPESISNLTSLLKLKIFNCPNLASLPEALSGIPSLEKLYIDRCPSLTALPESIGRLSSLLELEINECPKLAFLPEGFGLLTSLQELTIVECSSLTFLPESIGNLTSLSGLIMRKLPNLTSLPQGMTTRLSSLQRLIIGNCRKLTSLPEFMGNLTSLRELRIRNCPNLTCLPDSMGSLTSLSVLVISELPNLTSLPQGMIRLCSLRKLRVERCRNLTSLPEAMGNFFSQCKVRIVDCPNLMSLPPGIPPQHSKAQVNDADRCNSSRGAELMPNQNK